MTLLIVSYKLLPVLFIINSKSEAVIDTQRYIVGKCLAGFNHHEVVIDNPDQLAIEIFDSSDSVLIDYQPADRVHKDITIA